MPYDAGRGTGDWMWYAKGAGGADVIGLRHDRTNTLLQVYIAGGYRLETAATFVAGDWLDIVVTLNFTTDDYNLYVNGALVDNDGTLLTAPAITQWNLGADILAGNMLGGNYAEYAVFDRVLTADEIAALYSMNRPIVDAGAIDKPGIYILDGKFKIASSTTGNRIEIDADEIAGYSSAGVKQFYLQASDGKAVCGAGSVWLDASGVTLEAGVGAFNQVKWDSAGTTIGVIYGVDTGAAVTQDIIMRGDAKANTAYGRVILSATGAGALKDAAIYVRSGKTGNDIPRVYFDLGATEVVRIISEDMQILGGLYVGQLGVDPDPNDVWCDGEISTNGGTTRYHFSTVVLGAPAPDYKVNIEINGAAYQIPVYKV